MTHCMGNKNKEYTISKECILVNNYNTEMCERNCVALQQYDTIYK